MMEPMSDFTGFDEQRFAGGAVAIAAGGAVAAAVSFQGALAAAHAETIERMCAENRCVRGRALAAIWRGELMLAHMDADEDLRQALMD
jgi:hypothetical protein